MAILSSVMRLVGGSRIGVKWTYNRSGYMLLLLIPYRSSSRLSPLARDSSFKGR